MRDPSTCERECICCVPNATQCATLLNRSFLYIFIFNFFYNIVTYFLQKQGVGMYFVFLFFPKKTNSISYKILQMRVLYTNPCIDTIVPSYVDAH